MEMSFIQHKLKFLKGIQFIVFICLSFLVFTYIKWITKNTVVIIKMTTTVSRSR